MTRSTAAMIRLGERRLRDRRIAVPGDLTTELVNRITEDRDRLKAENRELRSRLVAREVMPHDPRSVDAPRPGCGCGRRGPVLSQEGRVPTDPMNSPLNPEVNPPPYAALR